MQQREDAITKIRAYLRDGGLRPGDRLPGERDLSAMLRIGRTGLRPVLADLEAEGYLERRPQSGTYLTQLPPSAARGQSVSLIAPFGDRTQPGRQEWLYRVAVAFERSAIAAGLRVAVRDQAPFLRDDSSVKTMALEAARSGAQAVVLLHPAGSRAAIARTLTALHDQGIFPIILSARTYPGMVSQVYFDSGWGTHMATRHLLRTGHRRIAFAGAARGHDWVRDRLDGYRSALEGSEITPRDEWVWLAEEGERLPDASDGADAFGVWQSIAPSLRPTAIVAANDVVALGLLGTARAAGVPVPDAFSLIGFDNDPEAMLAGLTTVERPTDSMGEAAARVVVEHFSGLRNQDAVSVRLRPVLIERFTVAPPGTSVPIPATVEENIKE